MSEMLTVKGTATKMLPSTLEAMDSKIARTIDKADRDHRCQMAAGSRMLATNMGAFWPCGHYRNTDTTHTIGDKEMCRTCRRRRWQKGFRISVARRQLIEKITRPSKDLCEDQFLSGRPIGQAIIETVAECFKLSTSDITGRGRTKYYTRPRFMAVTLLDKLTFKDGRRRFSHLQIGRMLGRDHSAVRYGEQQCLSNCERDPAYARIYSDIYDALVKAGYIVEAGND